MSPKTETPSSEMITLGQKWECFSCSAKFYDLGRTPVLCPKCSADQHDQDSAPSAEALAKEKKAAKKKSTKKKTAKKKTTKKSAAKKKKADDEEE